MEEIKLPPTPVCRVVHMVGKIYGRLQVLAINQKAKRCQCRCSCGKVVTVWIDDVRRGSTRSCGCLHAELAGRPFIKLPEDHTLMDWTKTNVELALEYNTCRQWVSTRRLQLERQQLIPVFPDAHLRGGARTKRLKK